MILPLAQSEACQALITPPSLGAPGDMLSPEVQMYNKPALVRFGTFREVTQGGPINWAIDLAADNWKELFFHETPRPSAS